MADNKTIHPVIFNDDYTHDGIFKREQYAELNDEQYNAAKDLFCGFDKNRPLITDTEKQGKPLTTANIEKSKEPAK